MVGFPNLTFDKRFLLVEKNCFFLIHLLAGVISLSCLYSYMQFIPGSKYCFSKLKISLISEEQ